MNFKIFLFWLLVFIPQTSSAETLKENYFKARGHLEMMNCDNLTLSDKSICLAAHSGYKQYLTFYNMGSYPNANHFYETMHKKHAISLIGEEEKTTFDIDHIKLEDIKAILAFPDPRNEKQQLLLGHVQSLEERKDEVLYLVELFLQQGGDSNSVVEETSGATLLIKAAFANNLNLIKLLVFQGVDVNKALINGTSALHISSARNTEIANFLLANGANPNVQDKLGDTPLHDVISKWLKYGGGNGIYIEDLVKAGGSLYVANDKGETPADLGKRLMREAYERKLFIAKQEEQKEQRRKMAEAEKEKNSFNFLKAITLTVGFVAGNGLKLEPEEQIRVFSSIIQDSLLGVEGTTNTMGALNGAKQKQGYQPDTNITKLEDTPNNDVKSKPKRYYAYYTCTWRVQRNGPDFMDYHRAISNLIEGDSNEELINNKRKAKEIVLSIASSSNNTTLQCDAINSSVEVWGAKTKEIENSLIKRHRTIYINRINKYKNATKRMQKANVNTGSSSRLFGHDFTMN